LPNAEYTHDEWYMILSAHLTIVRAAKNSKHLADLARQESHSDNEIVDLPAFFEDRAPPTHSHQWADMIMPAGIYDPVEMAYWTYFLNKTPVRNVHDIMDQGYVPRHTATTGTRKAHYWPTKSLELVPE